jgi:Bacterial Ig domain/Divergent InlB B-repeat domain
LGQCSVTNWVSVIHGVPLSVQISGLGTVTPNYNGQLLVTNQVYSMTARPGNGAVFTNWTGSLTTNSPTLTFVMQPELSFTANFLDVSNPSVTITAPTANQRVSNIVFSVTGTASDNVQVASVWCQLNSNDWVQAAGTTSWSTNLSLAGGTNTLRAYALDSSGLSSKTNAVTFVGVPHDHLTVQIIGNGTVSPNYSNAFLQVGRTLTMTAAAASGSVFSNWSGTITAITPKLTFTMQTGMVLYATFTTNPFPAVQGSYAGLFTNELPTTNSGAFTATVTAQGGLSGKLVFSSTNYALAGSFSGGGLYYTSIVRQALSPLTVSLQLDMVGKELITGQVSDGVWTNSLLAYRSVYSNTNPAPLAGQTFTVAIAGGGGATNQPAGYGFGTVTVDALGTIIFNGTLGDGTRVSQTNFLSRDGHWPLSVWPYSGQGGLLGWLTFTNEADRDIRGQVSWFRAPQAAAKLYPKGISFDHWLDVTGSLYAATNGMPLLDWTNGLLELAGGNLSQNLTNGAMLATNKLTGTNSLVLTITNVSGLFGGSLVNPATGQLLSLNGVLLQKAGSGYGTFLGTNQSGSVFLHDANVRPIPAPQFQSATESGGVVTLTWTTMAGVSYQLQYSSDVTGPNWVNLGDPTNATGSTMSFSDTLGSNLRRFYRVTLVR